MKIIKLKCFPAFYFTDGRPVVGTLAEDINKNEDVKLQCIVCKLRNIAD